MRQDHRRASPCRAILSVLALYGFLVQVFLAAAAPRPTDPATPLCRQEGVLAGGPALAGVSTEAGEPARHDRDRDACLAVCMAGCLASAAVLAGPPAAPPARVAQPFDLRPVPAVDGVVPRQVAGGSARGPPAIV